MLNLKVVPPRYWHHSPDYTSPDGSRYVTWDSSSLPPLQASAVPRGWELNPKPSTEQYLRRILHGVISLADTLKTWRSQGVTISFFRRDKPTCVHEHFETNFYSQAPRDAQFMRPPLRVQKPMAVISGSVPGRLDPNSVSVLTRYLYRCLTIKTNLVEPAGVEPAMH